MRYMGLGLGEDRRGEEDGREGGRESKASSDSSGYFGVGVCQCVCERD